MIQTGSKGGYDNMLCDRPFQEIMRQNKGNERMLKNGLPGSVLVPVLVNLCIAGMSETNIKDIA